MVTVFLFPSRFSSFVKSNQHFLGINADIKQLVTSRFSLCNVLDIYFWTDFLVVMLHTFKERKKDMNNYLQGGYVTVKSVWLAFQNNSKGFEQTKMKFYF